MARMQCLIHTIFMPVEIRLAAQKAEELTLISNSSLSAALAGAIPLIPNETYFATRCVLAAHVYRVQGGVCVEHTISLAHNGLACTRNTAASDPLLLA